MIELSGLSVQDVANPDGDIAIEIVGLRHAEKLYEKLLLGENPRPAAHARIMTTRESYPAWPQLQEELETIFALLGRLVPELLQMARENIEDDFQAIARAR